MNYVIGLWNGQLHYVQKNGCYPHEMYRETGRVLSSCDQELMLDNWVIKLDRTDKDMKEFSPMEIEIDGVGCQGQEIHVKKLYREGTLYLYEKKKTMRAELCEDDPTGRLIKEFGFSEVRFATPKRAYPAHICDPSGTRSLNWVHAPATVVYEHMNGIESEFHDGIADPHYIGHSRSFRIDHDVMWSVVDMQISSTVSKGHRSILYTTERRYDVLASNLQNYLRRHEGLVDYGFDSYAGYCYQEMMEVFG